MIWDKKRIKNLDVTDIGLIKATTAAFILFLITVWPAAMSLVHSIHWGWFLGAAIVLGIKPGIAWFK